jgi:hypothetical protein
MVHVRVVYIILVLKEVRAVVVIKVGVGERVVK